MEVSLQFRASRGNGCGSWPSGGQDQNCPETERTPHPSYPSSRRSRVAQDPSFLKRQKERARLQKRALKEERRAQRKEERKTSREGVSGDEDPDLAGIVPGPQPRPWADDEEAHRTESDEVGDESDLEDEARD